MKQKVTIAICVLFAFFCTFDAKASETTSYWKKYFSTAQREAIKKKADSYTREQFKEKSKKWKGLIRGYNIKDGSVKDEDIKEVGVEKIKGLNRLFDEKFSGSAGQTFPADNLTGSYAALNGSQITNINPVNISGDGDLNIGLGDFKMSSISAPDQSLPTMTAGGSGNLTGTYRYRITFVTASGETETDPDSSSSSSVAVTSQQVELSDIPVGPTGVIARRIYRTTSSAPFPHHMQLVATINNNTSTTYTDDLVDGSLGVYAPTINTTGATIYNGNDAIMEANKTLTILGHKAGAANNGGLQNTFIGSFSGELNTTGYYNTFLGWGAGNKNTTSGNNTMVGTWAGWSMTSGEGNTFVGKSASWGFESGSHNIFMGRDVAHNATNADENVIIGVRAGYGSNGATGSTMLGYRAGYSATGDYNTLIGYRAGDNITTGADNIIIGHDIDAPSATASNQLNIGNLIYGDLANERVGIGTGSPTLPLHIKGDNPDLFLDINSTSSSGMANMMLGVDGGILSGIGVSRISEDMVLEGDFDNNSTGNIVLSMSGTDRVTLNTTGNLGVGTTSPVDPLHVINTSNDDTTALRLGMNLPGNIGGSEYRWSGMDLATQGIARLGSAGNQGWRMLARNDDLGSSTASNLEFWRYNGSWFAPFSIADSGNVGIGTTTPEVALDVDGIIKTRERATATCDADAKGGIYFDSDDDHFYGCNGTSWIQLDN